MHHTLIHRLTLPAAILAIVFTLFAEKTMALAGIIYGVRDLGNQFVVSSIDLTDQGFAAELLVGNKPAQERIRDIILLADGRLTLLRINVVRDAQSDRSNIEFLGDPLEGLQQRPQDTIRLKGLPLAHGASTATRSNGGSGQPLKTLVSHFTDTPPYSAGVIDLATSQVSTLPIQLHEQARFANLTLCPDGITYGTSLGIQGGGVHLVRMDFELGGFTDIAKLRFEGKSLRDDLKSLTCSSSGELFVLGDPSYRGFNSLFLIDPLTGDLTFVRAFDVDFITSR
ncbi:MAG: hypothetical protein ABFR65_00240 [Pseudomonadota bacterium]